MGYDRFEPKLRHPTRGFKFSQSLRGISSTNALVIQDLDNVYELMGVEQDASFISASQFDDFRRGIFFNSLNQIWFPSLFPASWNQNLYVLYTPSPRQVLSRRLVSQPPSVGSPGSALHHCCSQLPRNQVQDRRTGPTVLQKIETYKNAVRTY